jgi:hydroxymethylbilane synthase
MLPAPGQGFIASETADQGEARRLCAALNSPKDHAEAACERALLARLEAGCQAPVGALARSLGQRLSLKAYVALKGRPCTLAAEGPLADPAALGWQLAEKALSLMDK